MLKTPAIYKHASLNWFDVCVFLNAHDLMNENYSFNNAQRLQKKTYERSVDNEDLVEKEVLFLPLSCRFVICVCNFVFMTKHQALSAK